MVELLPELIRYMASGWGRRSTPPAAYLVGRECRF
jgi:hypothetical protein